MNINKQGILALSLSALLAVCSMPSHAQSSEPLTPFTVIYEVSNNLISAGKASLSLQNDGDEWTYKLTTRPSGVFKLTGKGKIRETSIFHVAQSAEQVLTLLPQTYSYRQDKESKRSVDASFDWDKNEFTFTRRGVEATESFSGPLLDRLSVTLKVMHELKHRPFEETKLTIFDSDRIKEVLFTNEGEHSISTEAGKIKTIKVHSQNTGSSRHTITWFAPELDYVPVKIEQYKRGDLVARLTLVKLVNQPANDTQK